MIKFEGGQYEVTDMDRLWLLRAVEAEGPPQTRVAETLVNGFCFVRAKSAAWKAKTLQDFVRAYAQPVNPRWYVDGDLFLASIKGFPLNSQKRLDEQKKAMARKSVHSTKVVFGAVTQDAVNRALNGRIMHDVTDYAAPHIDGAKKGMVARSAAVQGQNRFWSRGAGWKGYLADTGKVAAAGGAGVAAVLLVAGAAWFLLKKGA